MKKILLHYFGVVLIMSSVFIAAPALVGVATKSPSELVVGMHFFAASSISLLLGLAFYLAFQSGERLTVRDGLYIVAMAWVTIPTIGAIPLSIALKIPYLDALFEAVSGFTTTGLTMLPDVESLPLTVLMWRSLMQWIGGVGIVIITLVVLARPGSPASVLYIAEGREERLEPSFARTAKAMFRIYLVLTAAITFMLWAAGMPLFDAINHAMTTISTGGFSVRNFSIGEYDSVFIEAVCVFAMFMGAQSFVGHSKMLRGRIREALGEPEVKGFLGLLVVFVGASILVLHLNGYGLVESVRVGVFQAVSALSTTGFQSVDLGSAPPLFKVLLSVAMLIGGSIFSTAGGIKIFRFLVVFKTLYMHVVSSFKPSRAIRVIKVGGTPLDSERIMRSLIIALLYIITHVVSVIIVYQFTPPEFTFEDVVFETASALGTVGLSIGLAGPMAHPVVKAVFIADMLLGRLEILTILAVIYGIFGGKSR